MQQSGANLLMRSLANAGVTTIFGYPGGAIMPIYDALFDHQKHLRHILVRHEQGATHAAQGYARASGKTGVCFATSGPGATNLITGLTDAIMDSTPIVCITGQVFSEFLGSDAFQEADVIGLTLACTKWNYQIADAAEIPQVISRAFRIASSGRPGPVLIDITKDAQANLVSIPPVIAPSSGNTEQHLPDLSPAMLDQAARLLNTAKRPFVFVGQGVLISKAEAIFQQMAETLGAPVASTLLGLSAFPSGHPLNVGMLGMHGHYAPNKLTQDTDVVLAIGMRFDDRVTGKVSEFALNATIIHIDIDPSEFGRHVDAAIELAGDARKVMEQLHPRLKKRQHDHWLDRFRHLAEEERKSVSRNIDHDHQLSMARVITTLAEKTAGEALLVTDVGQHQMMTARYYRFKRSQSFISSGGAGTMGFALPAAIGAKIAVPKRQVIAIIGDGGFQMTQQELGTIMQENLDIKIIILNNRFLGMVRQWQELFFDKRYSFVEMRNPDFIKLCSAYNIDAESVSQPDCLDAAFNRLLSSQNAYLLDISVLQEENVFPMIPSGAAAHDIQLEATG